MFDAAGVIFRLFLCGAHLYKNGGYHFVLFINALGPFFALLREGNGSVRRIDFDIPLLFQ